MPAPIAYRWNGTAMVPMPRFEKECDLRYAIGEIYTLDDVLERSSKSHHFYFAELKSLWASLPEAMAHQREFQTPEHARHTALIRTGFANIQDFVCSSRSEALRMGSFIEAVKEYSIVEVRARVVRVYTAQSQAFAVMDRRTFEQSKAAVLGYLGDLVGVASPRLEAHARD